MDKTLEKRMHIFYFAGLILISFLPLFSFPPLMHPSSWGKAIIFRIIISIILFLALYQTFFLNKKLWEDLKIYLKNKKSGLFLALFLLLLLGVVYILSTIFSLEPTFSFWGNPSRGLGSITIILLIAYSLFIFLILKERGWQILWDINIFVGILISLVAIIQKFSLLPKIINPQSYQPFSTMGNAILLGIYLMLLVFPALSFGFKKLNIKSLFYFGSVILFIAGILAAASRSPILGLITGFLFFLFFYPKKTKRIIIVKIGAVGLIILSIIGTFWLNANLETAGKIEKIPIIGTAFYRIWDSARPLLNLREITFEKIVSEGRYSGWQVLWPSLKDRPLLGYGPENISIPFDKNYDPSIKGITSVISGGGSGWWDRAHNIFLELGLTIGIPGLLIYLLIFITLFLKLQRIKKESDDSKKIIATGLQATFISYFVALFFNFDSFSTYLVVFSLIGYSLFLIKKDREQNPTAENKGPALWKYIFATFALFIVVWFIWSNIDALFINKELNKAEIAVNLKIENCPPAIQLLDKTLLKHSFIDNYVRLKFIDVIGVCIDYYPEKQLEFSKKAVPVLQEAKESRPYYTRSWTYFAVFSNKIIESDTSLSQEQKKDLANQALESLKRAAELSPKRQEMFLTYIKTYLLIGEKEKAAEKAKECIETNPEVGDCYWANALTLIAKDPKNSDLALEQIKIAISKGYTDEAYSAVSQLVKVYSSLAEQAQDIKYYEILEQLYIKKLAFDYTKFQDHASLAFVYRELGKYDKARQEAEIVLELSPESKDNVDAFLKTLPE